MSAKKITYQAIGEHLMEEIGGEGTIESPDGTQVPCLQWYDKNRGQLQHFTKELGIPFPAVLISFPEINYILLGAGVKRGETVIRVTTLFESYADSYHGSIDQEVALQYFEFNNLINSVLDGFSGDLFSPLVRVREVEDDDHDFLIITQIDYATELTDTAGVKKVAFVSGNPAPVKTQPQPPSTPDNRSGQFVL